MSVPIRPPARVIARRASIAGAVVVNPRSPWAAEFRNLLPGELEPVYSRDLGRLAAQYEQLGSELHNKAQAIDQQVQKPVALQAEAARTHRFAARRRAMAPEPPGEAADRAFPLVCPAAELHGVGNQ